jgi:hypothetical protein
MRMNFDPLSPLVMGQGEDEKLWRASPTGSSSRLMLLNWKLAIRAFQVSAAAPIVSDP